MPNTSYSNKSYVVEKLVLHKLLNPNLNTLYICIVGLTFNHLLAENKIEISILLLGYIFGFLFPTRLY